MISDHHVRAQGGLDVRTDQDAEVCLQMANSLTLALLNYRLKMLPSLVSFSYIAFFLKTFSMYW